MPSTALLSMMLSGDIESKQPSLLEGISQIGVSDPSLIMSWNLKDDETPLGNVPITRISYYPTVA